MNARVFVMALLLAVLGASPVLAQDLDRDGLSDAFEQALLERFRPTFVLSAGECDGRPASFVAGTEHPTVAARDGTIYGQVTPHAIADGDAAEIEIKFFHLWGLDCGRGAHHLDAEHVSALVAAPSATAPLDAWEARFWYAAAHEDTVCDAGNGARASAVGAVTSGPEVFVSRGKHASYLDRHQCKWGCGGDQCDPHARLEDVTLVNLGERGAPLNGATWVESRQWPMASKLTPDFDPVRRDSLDGADPRRVSVLRLGLRAWQAPILGGDTTIDALAIAGESANVASDGAAAATGTAVGAAVDAAGTALDETGSAVGLAFRKTGKGIAWFFGLR